MGAIDQRLDSVTALLHQGMQLRANALIEAQQNTEQAQQSTAEKLPELAEARKIAAQKLQALLDSLRNGRNGH
jgi:hypothetical protein